VSAGFQTPVVLIVYNRPELTTRVVNALAAVRPRRLLVIADGPRSRADERSCAQVRALFERIDWECDIDRDYADANLGVRLRPPTGLDWAFRRVPEAIVLEDDCVPHPSFFGFCAELLAHYRNDERVMQIAGANFQRGRRRSEHGYYFSLYHNIWGWATWARAWRHYDVEIERWPELKAAGLLESLPIGAAARRYWTRIFDSIRSGRAVSWDFQWQLAMWSQYGVAAASDVNLISNIGFGPSASHTTVHTWHADMLAEAVTVRGHPPGVVPSRDADSVHFQDRLLHQSPWLVRQVSRIRRRVAARGA
jgi:hypothetical protein